MHTMSYGKVVLHKGPVTVQCTAVLVFIHFKGQIIIKNLFYEHKLFFFLLSSHPTCDVNVFEKMFWRPKDFCSFIWIIFDIQRIFCRTVHTFSRKKEKFHGSYSSISSFCLQYIYTEYRFFLSVYFYKQLDNLTILDRI